MRESASRGFWMTSYAPFGYSRVMVQDGAGEATHARAQHGCVARIVNRIFDMG